MSTTTDYVHLFISMLLLTLAAFGGLARCGQECLTSGCCKAGWSSRTR